MSEQWQRTKPPNDVLVEVSDGGIIRRVRAIWGRDGLRPHWESEDEDTKWSPEAFTMWRAVTPPRSPSDEEQKD